MLPAVGRRTDLLDVLGEGRVIYLFVPRRPFHDPGRGRWTPWVFGYTHAFWETAPFRELIWAP